MGFVKRDESDIVVSSHNQRAVESKEASVRSILPFKTQSMINKIIGLVYMMRFYNNKIISVYIY